MIRLLKNTKLINMSNPIAIKEKEQEDLPYYKLDYIETTGGQYIQTGVGANANKVRIQCKVLFTQKGNNQDGFVWSSRTWSYQYGNMYGYGDLYNDSGNSQLTLYYGRNQSTGVNSFDKNIEYEVDCIADQTSIDITINDNHQTISRTMDAPTADIVLFRQGDESAYYAKCRLSYFKIYLEDQLVRNFIPVMMKETKAIGLYDLISNEFYANEGSGNFVPSLIRIKNYTELKYIKSTGSQYIDTGILAAGDTDIEVKFKCKETEPSYMRVYGIESATGYEMCMGGDTNTLWYFNGSSTTRTIDARTDYKTVKFTASDGKLYVDGEYLSTENIPGTLNKNLWLFRGNDRYSNICLSYCKIWKNGTLVRNLIPIETPDGLIGLYDLVEQGLIINSGSGDFTPGYYSLPHTEHEYIESTGTQIIDTKYYPSSVTKLELKFANVVNNVNWAVVMKTRTDRKLIMQWNSPESTDLAFYFNNYSYTFNPSMYDWHVATADFITGNFSIDDVVANYSPPGWGTNILLFNSSKFKIAYLKVWENDVLVHHFVPAKNSNNVACMYDNVEVEFLYNTGTGDFILGNEIGE